MSNVKLKAPEGTTSASVGGVEYIVDAKGSVSVPADQAINLYAFGFHHVADEVAEEPEAQAAAEAQEEGGKGGSTKAKK